MSSESQVAPATFAPSDKPIITYGDDFIEWLAHQRRLREADARAHACAMQVIEVQQDDQIEDEDQPGSR